MSDYTVRIDVLHKDIYGSISKDNEYGDDKVVSVIEWLQDVLDDVPAEYRDSVRIEIDSVGGYEGEHHTEVTIYYDRPETEEEHAARSAAEKRMRAEMEKRERAAFEELAKKYGART